MPSLKKNLFVLALFGVLLLTSCATTQRTVTWDGPIIKVYDATGSKDELFIRSNRWMISIFRDARNIIQYSDKDEGILIGKYLLHEHYNAVGMIETIYAIIEINVKDNKARISVTPDNYSYATFKLGDPEQDPAAYTGKKAMFDIEVLCSSFYRGVNTEASEL